MLTTAIIIVCTDAAMLALLMAPTKRLSLKKRHRHHD